MRTRIAIIIVLLCMAASPLMAQEAAKNLLTQQDVIQVIKKNKKDPDTVIKTLHDQGVEFDLDRDIEKKMRKAGATDQILQAIWAAGPTVRNFKGAVLTSATGTPLEANYEEAMGFQTLQKEMDPDRKISMVSEFEREFPHSQLLSYVYTQAASAYEAKGDFANAALAGQKSLKLDPDNIFSLLVVATALSEPSMSGPNSDNAAKNLLEAEADARRALELADKMPAREGEAEEQLNARKSGLASDAHAALGAAAMLKDNLGEAVSQFKQAISMAAQPKASLYFRLGEIYANTGHKQDAIDAFTKAAEIGRGTVIETYANQSIKELQ